MEYARGTDDSPATVLQLRKKNEQTDRSEKCEE